MRALGETMERITLASDDLDREIYDEMGLREDEDLSDPTVKTTTLGENNSHNKIRFTFLLNRNINFIIF